jgi:transcriptional regulator with XRE-family HTH domain
MKESNLQPFSVFGDTLRSLRVKNRKTLAEVSGAVEVPQTVLEAYEKGEKRPTEDILLLLIQHFQLKDLQAKELWRLAGYEQMTEEGHYFVNDDDGESVHAGKTAYVYTDDMRVVYTDLVHVMVNNYGVIMNFMQGAGPQNKPLAVARVGMSKEHARSIIELLKATLDQQPLPQQQKLLPPSKSKE